MTATHINICTDSELEAQALSVLSDLGLDMSAAINGFLTQVVREKSVPFEVEEPKTPHGKRPRSEFWGCMEGKINMADDFNAPMELGREDDYLIPPDPTKIPQPGCMRGKIWMADDFDAPLEDFAEYM